MSKITAQELALWKSSDMLFTLLDVRRDKARQDDGTEIRDAQWFDPARWLDWKDDISPNRLAVVYCAHGHEISQGLAATLCAMGIDARHLVGGIATWKAAGFETSLLKNPGESS